ncbi:LysE family translocator [Fulvivirga maritima]|uniref:LysE family translocator n=1 Tax=Fulvivirga maritima TaxID=2904247 RepID=UPI001F2D58C1|nr:LysE family transporter [Fulvivirga maritima]UII27261.1 LysE family translocator [Fulvivirga maritima]
MYIVNGALFGLLLMVLVGPVFFTLIQTSLEKGFNKAILVALGIFFSDAMFIGLAYLGVSQFVNKSGYNAWIGYIGGVILTIFGIYYLVKFRRPVNMSAKSVSVKGTFRFIFKGFLINGISPFVLLFWVGAMSLATVRYGYHGHKLLGFFLTIMIIALSSDIMKAYLAGKLRRLFTPRLFKILNLVVGLAMIGFGIHMFIFSI